MDHDFIRDEQLIEGYVLGRLDDPTREAMEAHLLYCASCREDVTDTERFARGLAGVPGMEMRHEPWQRSHFLVSVAACLLVALGLSWFHGRSLQTSLKAEREKIDQLTRQQSQPIGNTTLFPLSPVRGEAESPAAVLDLTRAGPLVVLSLELAQVAARYEVHLSDQDGNLLWKGLDLVPDYQDALQIAVPTSMLKMGNYRLEALSEAGSPVVFFFRVQETQLR